MPGTVLELSMGVNANDSAHFYSSWEKTLAGVADGISAEIVQKYLEQTAIPTLAEYLFDYPIYLAVVSSTIILLVLMAALYIPVLPAAKSGRRKYPGSLRRRWKGPRRPPRPSRTFSLK